MYSPVINRSKPFANVSTLNRINSASPTLGDNHMVNPVMISRFNCDEEFTDCFTPPEIYRPNVEQSINDNDVISPEVNFCSSDRSKTSQLSYDVFY